MRKLLLLALVFLAAAFVLSNLRYLSNLSDLSQKEAESSVSKKPILRVALVADSHSENGLLAKALAQAQGKGVNFVIGLGDYTNLGTMEELNRAREEFDKSKLEYFVTAGDRDGWESRQIQEDNFAQVFGQSTRIIDRENIRFVILDNSDIYSGISQEGWEILESITSGQGITSTTGLENFSEKARDTRDTLNSRGTLTFVFAHKTPFHPESKHVMGEDSGEVSKQAKEFMDLMEKPTRPCHSELSSESKQILKPFDNTQGKQVQDDKLCPAVDGLFSGDMHFFAQYKSPNGSAKITTVGAVASKRNFQGPRFAILTVYEDYSWEVEDVEIR